MDTYRRLVESLRLIAAPANVQLAQIPKQACRPDEIAFIAEEIVPMCERLFEEGGVTKNICQSVSKIDNYFLEFSNQDWTEQQLISSSKWQKIRKMALDTILEMGESWQVPNLFWIKDLF